MDSKFRATSRTLLAVVVMMAGPALSQDEPDRAERAEMTAKFMELAQPGPEHERLETMAGTWHTETSIWMSPGAEPMTVPGKVTNKMILGGRFLMTEAKSGEGMMAVESVGLMGFDRRSGLYTTVGVDTWGTYSVSGSGTWDEKRGAIVMSGEDYDAAMDYTQVYDFVLTPLTPDTYRFEVIFRDELHTQGKGPFKMVEVFYTKLEEE